MLLPSNVLQDENTTATVLLTILVDRFGIEVLDWDPKTVEMEIWESFKIKNLPETNLNKIQALITALTTNLFQVSVEAFHHIANALNGSDADFDVWDPVTAEEAAWAITEVMLNDPPEDGDDAENSFSHEVRGYLGVICSSEGVKPFGVLEVAELPYQAGADNVLADDPLMYSAVEKKNETDRDEITRYILERLRYTVETVKELSLQRKDSKTYEAWLEKGQLLPKSTSLA